MTGFERIVRLISHVLGWVAGATMVTIMALIVANILSRAVYKPIIGIIEAVTYAFGIAVCFGLAYTAVQKGHVTVDLVISRLTQRSQAAVRIVASLFSIVVFAVIAWQSAVFGLEKWLTMGESDPVLKIPVLPFRLVVTMGSTALCLVFFTDLIRSLKEVIRK